MFGQLTDCVLNILDGMRKEKKKKQFINIMMMFVGLKENKLGAPVISKHVPKHI